MDRRQFLANGSALAASVAMMRPAAGAAAPARAEITPATFRAPPFQYRPIASLGGGGGMAQNAAAQAKTLFRDNGFGSIMFSPSGDPDRKPAGTGRFSIVRPTGLLESYPPGTSRWVERALPGEVGNGMTPPTATAANSSQPAGLPAMLTRRPTGPGFLTPAYFDQVKELLSVTRADGRFATFYDEVTFPTGMADHTVPENYCGKALRKQEFPVAGGTTFEHRPDPAGVLMAAVAMNTQTGQRINLRPFMREGTIRWTAPAGNWKAMIFRCIPLPKGGVIFDYIGAADPMDPEAVQWFIDTVYGKMDREVGSYFGNTVNMTFFDDIGLLADDKAWTNRFNAKFRELIGRDPELYYPALWEDIGPDTAAARVAFFRTRAELLSLGFPKMVSDWTRKHGHGMQQSGHCAGNYEPQPVNMNGDPFKFYYHADIPMADDIFGYSHGRSGFKMITSSADENDKPIVAVETFGSGGHPRGYQRMIDLYLRGMNRFVVGAFNRRGGNQPARGGPAAFAEWSGRCSMLLQGGARVADVAVVYPIGSLMAFYSFDAPGDPPGLPLGRYIYDDCDFQAVGEMLHIGDHRDFTFLHPDTLAKPRIRVEKDRLVLANAVNRQSYRAVVLPGGAVISAAALRKIQAYYDAGGTVVATSLLPSRSAEFGKDAEVVAIIRHMFGIDPRGTMPTEGAAPRTNARGGKAAFLREPSTEALAALLDRLGVSRDVVVERAPAAATNGGQFSYVHKVHGTMHAYFFGNSGDTAIDTRISLRGVTAPAYWDPHSGEIHEAVDVRSVMQGSDAYVSLPLALAPNSSLFVVARAGRAAAPDRLPV